MSSQYTLNTVYHSGPLSSEKMWQNQKEQNHNKDDQ